MFRDALTINHDNSSKSVFTSNLNTLHTLTTVIHNSNTSHVFEQFTNISRL